MNITSISQTRPNIPDFIHVQFLVIKKHNFYEDET